MFDIKGKTCEMNGGINCDTYIIIKIDDEQVFKSKTIDNNSHPTFEQTFVSDFINMDAIIAIEMWDSDLIADDLMSVWKGNAEFFATHGEQTLLGEKTSNNRQNSLTIRAKYIRGGEQSKSM